MEINLHNNIIPLNTALASTEGTVSLYLSPLASSTHSLFPRSSKKVEVPCTTLNTLGKRFKDKNFDLVKIDVEGAELEVLNGGKTLLRNKRIKRLIIVAYHSPTEAKELTPFIENFGYVTNTYSIGSDNYIYAEVP